MSRTVKILRAALAALLLWPAAPLLAADAELELRVKAAFLFNFAKFVTWPAGKFASAQSPIEVCVLDGGALATVLEDSLRGKVVEGRPLVVRISAGSTDLRPCHLLYAGATDEVALNTAFTRAAGAAVLTVHEAAAALPGGVARFFVEGRKLRFELNTAAAERENLQLSAKLQSVATVVRR